MTFSLQILHASDLEGGLDAIENAPNFAAIVDALEADAATADIPSILLSAGDNYIPGPFFNAGGDFSLAATYEGFYNQLFGLIDTSVLDPGADTNGDGFFDNSEIEAQIAGGIVTFDQVYTTDVNGDGFKDYFEEIDTSSGRLDIAILNALGVDASALGNHEFDAGTDILENAINYDSEEGNSLSNGRFGTVNYLQEVDTPGVQFPYLSGNLEFSMDGDVGPLFTNDILSNTDFVSDLLSARDNPADPSATASDSNDAKVAQATVINAGGEQIGVVGATTQLLASISSPGNINDVSSPGNNDMAALAATLQPIIDDLIDGADNTLGTTDDINKVILVSHLQQFALEAELASLLRGVDVIIAGGSDTRSADSQDRLRPSDTTDQPYPAIVTNADGDPTAVVSTDGEYSYVGRLVVEFDDNGVLIPGSIDENVSGAFATDEQGVLEVTGESTLADAINASEKATLVQNLAQTVTGVVTTIDGQIAGEVSVFLNGSRESVRTQETNFGNLTADANLAAAQAFDDEVLVSIKNGGGIRASIGELVDNGDGTTSLLPTAANPLSGKEAGEVSELDIDNALRFDNGLVTVELTPEELKIILEHGVAATAPGATPGQFPQVGGISFSFDPSGTAQVLNPDGSVAIEGTRIKNVVLIDEDGNATKTIIADGEMADNAPASIKVVTLNFLADGGDGYPFSTFSDVTDLGIGEQQALSDFLKDNFPEDGPASFDTADTPIAEDTRIQNLSERSDTVELVDNPPLASGALNFQVYAEFQGEGGEGASEVVAHEDGKLYVTNGELGRIDVFTLPQGSAPDDFIDLTGLEGFDSVQSVAVKNGVVAVAISRDVIESTVFGEVVALSQPGFVALFDAATGDLLSRVDVGNLPDQLTFNEDGTQLLVAGEGEKNDDSDHDDNPLGTVAIINTTDPTTPVVEFLDFTAFNGLEDLARDAGIRIQEGVSFAEDVEPEYIAVSPDGSTAFVSLQENNAIAKIDLTDGSIVDVFSLGIVDFSSDSKLDPNDDGIINIANFDNVLGFRMADAIASFEIGGKTYIATANEGDSRDFDEDRVGDLVDDGKIDPSVDITGLERLEVSTIDGDTDGDGDIDVIHTFSSRSFSIFDEDGNLVFDSGPEFEQIIADLAPERFNDDDGDTDGDEDRSDAKGPEPEAITVGEIDGTTYAFIGLERDSGIMIYDISDPANSTFVNYIPPIFVDTAAVDENARHAPEVIAFIPAEDSTSGNAQIAVAYEVSGTTVVYDLTPAVPMKTIMDIQGAGHISAYDGQVVKTSGIVTAIDGAGLYLQDPDGDGDDATSDGIFVFTGFGNVTVDVGDAINIRGLVSEFIPGGAGTGNLSTTQISNAEIEVVSSGNTLPAATVIGAAGRTPPTDTVISDSELPVDLQTDPGTFNPDVDGIDFYESLEGMLVTVDNPAAISATNGFGESWVVADDGAGVTSPTGGLNDRGGLNINADADGFGDVNPERIQIQYDGDLLPDGFDAPNLTIGDKLSDVTGVVGYGFGNYEINVTEAFDIETPSANVAETADVTTGDDYLTVATYNILNVTAAPADGDAAQIAQLADQIANNLGSPDILALQEVQDDSGVVNDGTLAAEETLQAIVDAIEAAGGPRYAFVSAIVDEDGEGGGVPGGNIRNTFLYNTDRVEAKDFITLESDVLADMGVTHSDAFDGTRDPLLGVFEFNGEEITLINNHMTSRFGSTPIFGGQQPFVQAGEDAREAQAQALNELVDLLLSKDPDAKISVLGDLNTFDFTDELTEDLPGVGAEKVLTNLIGQLDGNEASTFNFQGNSQVLDHIFVTDRLLERADVDIVHVNNDFSNFASDHEPVIASFFLPQGEGADQRLVGSPLDDLLEGASGNDTVLGLNGDDTLTGEDGDDKLLGFRGNDEIKAGDGNDSVVGGNGNDMLHGDDGDDVIRGGKGDDTIKGGEGDDMLIGNSGADEFIFEGAFGNDIITRFDEDNDILTFVGSTLDDLVVTDVDNGTLITAAGDAEGTVLLKGVFEFDTDTLFV